jgi:hypothetical protein
MSCCDVESIGGAVRYCGDVGKVVVIGGIDVGIITVEVETLSFGIVIDIFE